MKRATAKNTHGKFNKGQKRLVVFGILAAILIIPPAVAFALGRHKKPPGFLISVSPTSLTSAGGNVQVTGAPGQLPPGTNVDVILNDTVSITVTAGSDGSLGPRTIPLAANTTSSPIVNTIKATTTVNGVLLTSNTVTVTVAASSGGGLVFGIYYANATGAVQTDSCYSSLDAAHAAAQVYTNGYCIVDNTVAYPNYVIRETGGPLSLGFWRAAFVTTGSMPCFP